MISGTNFSIDTEVSRQKKLSDQIANLQTQISGGTRVNKPSDDPVAMRRIAQILTTQASQQTWSSNITIANQISSQVEDNLNSVQTQLTRAKELILQAKTGTGSPEDRAASAAELQGIIGELDTLSNATDFTGQPLYAATGTSPVAIPVGDNLALNAAESYDRVFGSVTLKDNSTTSIKALLTSAVTAIQNGDTAAMADAADAVDSAASHVSVKLSDAGVRTQRIQTAQDRLETAKIDLEDERSSLQDTDVTAASAALIQKKTQLDAAQAILAQLSKTTLFDKLA
jgi:flagellar hook-associated protein 3 FlgL